MGKAPSTDLAFRRLFDAHHASIQAYCFRRLRSDSANDAAAEVFVVAWQKIDIVPAGDEARLWLYGIARNIVRNHQRSERRVVRLKGRLSGLARHPEPDPATLVVRRADHQELLAEVARLPEVDQEILRLRNWEELTAPQIASVTGMSVSAVETRLSRARKKLAQRVETRALVRPHPVEEGGER